MDRTADLDAALKFVIRRVEEQAALLGVPLTDEQRFLLNNLPFPSYSMPVARVGLFLPPPLVPRDVNYERVCALGKAAYLNDRQVNPGSLDWDFAFAVFKLNRQPMWGLLYRAGVKYKRPWWDHVLLLVAALLLIAGSASLILLAGEEPRTLSKWAGIGCGYAGILILMFFASRRIEKRQLEEEIERCRRASGLAGTVNG